MAWELASKAYPSSNFKYRIFHTRIKAGSRIGPHNQDVLSVIIGSLLGDSYANRRSVEGTIICYRESSINKEYLFWLYNFFLTNGYVRPNSIQSKVSVLDPNLVIYSFDTLSFRSFNWISDMFLKNNKPFLSFKVEDYLTPLALGIWALHNGREGLNGEFLLYTNFHNF